MAEEPKKPPIDKTLNLSSAEKYRTAGELIERSRPSAAYYVLLAISAVIVAAGILLDNAAVVIGGMLVAPVLTPLLAISLGLSIGEITIMRDTAMLLIKSFLIVAFISLIMAILLGNGQATFNMENDMRAAILYFIVALAAGAAATFAWARKELSEILPGVAIAVALVPPMSLVGIWLSKLNVAVSRFYLSVFLLNLFGVIIGSLIIFSLLRFYRASERIHQKVVTEEAAAERQVAKEAKEVKEVKGAAGK